MDDIVARSNIRIEIQNDVVNEMGLDESGEIEEGEVNMVDEDEIEMPDVISAKKRELLSRLDTGPIAENTNGIIGNKWWNKDGGFATGINIICEDEQSKRNVRAERFGIDPSESKSITEEQMQELYDSLGITNDVEKMIRFDALHMRGVEEMSTKDIFGYFSAYGPSSIEWINDYSCNVIWLDNVSSARALHGLSKKINGFDLLDEENPFESKQEKKEPTKGRSILLINTEEPQELEWKSEEPIDLINITVPIPPGYWRFGKPHSKAKTILFRFAFKTDRKAFKAEKLSDYYKKHGNPNFGGLRGLISQSKKRQMKFGGNREVRLTNVDDKDPWGSLAQSWSNEDRGIAFNEPKETVIPVKVVEEKPIVSNSIQDRIGLKRKLSEEEEKEDSEEVKPNKRSKVPRMRMYADEEQDRINRLKALKKLATVADKIESSSITLEADLRARLIQSSDRRKAMQTKAALLPDFTIRIPHTTTVPEPKLNRFVNRLGEKVKTDEVKNGKSHSSEEAHTSRQRSTVKVVVRPKPSLPTIASTISKKHTSSHRHDKKRDHRDDRPRRLSDRDHFHSSKSEPRRDLRNKIVKHTSKGTLLRKIKKESSSESSSSESSSTDSSSSSSSESSSSDEEEERHRSIMKKNIVSDRGTFHKGDAKIAASKEGLRIEVENDIFKRK